MESNSDIETTVDKDDDAPKTDVYNFFYVKDKSRTAECIFCENRIINQKNKLVKHMKTKHEAIFIAKGIQDDYEEDSDEAVSDDQDIVNYDKKTRRSRSLIWKYYKKIENDSAICLLCKNTLSYKGSVSNLKRHLIRRHEDSIDINKNDPNNTSRHVNANDDSVEGSLSEEEITIETIDKRSKSKIWNSFNIVSSSYARCIHCKSLLRYKNLQNLHRHMKQRHKTIDFRKTTDVQKIIETNEDIKAEDDQAEHDIFDTEEIYLEKLDDDFYNSLKDNVNNKKKTKHLEIKTRRLENLNKEEDDSIDIFGRYLMCLMKQLPKPVSNKLQMDFVKQTMEAMITCDSQTSSAADSANISNIAISISNLDR